MLEIVRLRILVAALLAAMLGDCSGLPPLLQGVSPAPASPGSPQFKQRLAERFPAGSSEAALVDELLRNGFAREGGDTASFTRLGDFLTSICRFDAQVRWSADSGKLTLITGDFYETCP